MQERISLILPFLIQQRIPFDFNIKYTLPFFYTTVRHYALSLKYYFMNEKKKYLSCKHNNYGYISIHMTILIKIFNDS